jgi:hypothetical protein
MMQAYIFHQRDGRFDAVIEAKSEAHARLRGALLCIAILGQRDFSRVLFDIRVHGALEACDTYFGDEFFYPFEKSLGKLFANCGPVN